LPAGRPASPRGPNNVIRTMLAAIAPTTTASTAPTPTPRKSGTSAIALTPYLADRDAWLSRCKHPPARTQRKRR